MSQALFVALLNQGMNAPIVGQRRKASKTRFIPEISNALFVAASLSSEARQNLGIQALSRSVPISHLATEHQVSRKFVYQQGDKAQQALDTSFAPSQGDDDVLFHLPARD